jgi:hypothetical protein
LNHPKAPEIGMRVRGRHGLFLAYIYSSSATHENVGMPKREKYHNEIQDSFSQAHPQEKFEILNVGSGPGCGTIRSTVY